MLILPYNNLSPTYDNYLTKVVITHLAKETPNFQRIVKAKITDIRKSMYREVWSSNHLVFCCRPIYGIIYWMCEAEHY